VRVIAGTDLGRRDAALSFRSVHSTTAFRYPSPYGFLRISYISAVPLSLDWLHNVDVTCWALVRLIIMRLWMQVLGKV